MHCIRLFTLVLSVILIIGLSIWGCVESCLLPSLAAGTDTDPTAAPVSMEAEATPAPVSAQQQEPGPSPTPEPAATPEPTPEPTPALDMIDGRPVVDLYNDHWPADAVFDLSYDKYDVFPNYFVALKSANVRREPSSKAEVLRTLSYGQRIQLLATIKADDKVWYYVQWTKSGETRNGYISESTGISRSFDVQQMLAHVNRLRHVMDSGRTVYIANYKNASGNPPKHPHSSSEDSYGYQRYQSAPGYMLPDSSSEFRYVPDGMLGVVEEQYEGYTKIYFPSFDQSLWVPDKYLSRNTAIQSLTQAIVVDRAAQNAGVFQLEDGVWKLISLSYVSTGKTSFYALPTPLGDFMAIERRDKFLYYADGTTIIDGYAPYAIRFSGGGYLHGVPRRYSRTDAGALIDPGMSESLSTLGTYPTSHMCIRNYTSHAKFMYDWVDIGNCAVIVFE